LAKLEALHPEHRVQKRLALWSAEEGDDTPMASCGRVRAHHPRRHQISICSCRRNAKTPAQIGPGALKFPMG